MQVAIFIYFKVKMCIKQLPICPVDVRKVLILGCMIDLTSNAHD
jgi:hypothetical protein